MEKLGKLQPIRSPRVGHVWATSLSLFTKSIVISKSVLAPLVRKTSH